MFLVAPQESTFQCFLTQLTASQPAKLRGRPQNADRLGRKRRPAPIVYQRDPATKHEFDENRRLHHQQHRRRVGERHSILTTSMADRISTEMQSFASRVATFQQPHQLSKRRASSQGKKKAQQTAEWPHESPSPEEVCRLVRCVEPHTDRLQARTRRLLLQAQPRLKR